MPHLTVHLPEEALDGAVEPKIIQALTNAAVNVFGEHARPLAVVELVGIRRNRWGSGGVPVETDPAIVTLNMRERALDGSIIGDAPALLIASITDAVVGVFGEPIREHVNVLTVGTPAGRSGVGGEVV